MVAVFIYGTVSFLVAKLIFWLFCDVRLTAGASVFLFSACIFLTVILDIADSLQKIAKKGGVTIQAHGETNYYTVQRAESTRENEVQNG